MLEVQPERLLVVTHYSPMSGQPDVPQSYQTITYRLVAEGGSTRLSLVQDNNASAEETEHSRSTWQSMLEGLKHLVESEPA